MRVISLGAGVQSTALLMLALDGDLDADCAIFADTGWEPAAVYEHLERLKATGFPIHSVTAGNIREDSATPGRFASMPFFLGDTGTGRESMARRQCTNEYKITPIRRKLRELGAHRTTPATVLMGISLEEVQRMRDSDVRYIRNEYPLVDRGWRRHDCVSYLESKGIEAPRSACVGCPFRSNREWLALTDEEVADAADFERRVQRNADRFNGKLFLHRSLKPIAEAVADAQQFQEDNPSLWDDECAGVCGV